MQWTEWNWSGPINGWELVLGAVVGIITTVISVYIGIRVALDGERRATDAAADQRRLDEEAVDARRASVSLNATLQTALTPMWFNGPGPALSLYDNWRPLEIEQIVRAAEADFPESQKAVWRWIENLANTYVSQGNLHFPTADNAFIRADSMRFEAEVKYILEFANGSRKLAWFAERAR